MDFYFFFDCFFRVCLCSVGVFSLFFILWKYRFYIIFLPCFVNVGCCCCYHSSVNVLLSLALVFGTKNHREIIKKNKKKTSYSRFYNHPPTQYFQIFFVVYLLKLSSECLVSYDPHFPGNDGTKKFQRDAAAIWPLPLRWLAERGC